MASGHTNGSLKHQSQWNNIVWCLASVAGARTLGLESGRQRVVDDSMRAMRPLVSWLNDLFHRVREDEGHVEWIRRHGMQRRRKEVWEAVSSQQEERNLGDPV